MTTKRVGEAHVRSRKVMSIIGSVITGGWDSERADLDLDRDERQHDD